MRIRWRGLELPNRVGSDRATLTDTYGRFIAEPFERGFGVTVGNSLRRILLSSLEGSAVTRVKIQGVQHEINTLPGVVEDVTDIILNIKSLVVKNVSEQPRTLRIDRHERGVVKAADIITDESVQIINPEHIIATLTDDVPFVVEMTVENGRGYRTADENAGEEREIGVIPVDSSFSPVVRVKYEIEDTRVGQRTNYDKLLMEIWTNGTVSPQMALVEGAKILRKHLNPFIQYAEPGPEIAVEEKLRYRQHARVDRSRAGAQTQHEPGRAGTVGAGHELPRIRRHHHGPRPGDPQRRGTAGSAQLRRNDVEGSAEQVDRAWFAPRHEAADFGAALRNYPKTGTG